MAISTDKIPEYKLVDIRAALEEATELVDSCLEYIHEERKCAYQIHEIEDRGFDASSLVSRDDMLEYFNTQREQFSALISSQSWAIKTALDFIKKKSEEVE